MRVMELFKKKQKDIDTVSIIQNLKKDTTIPMLEFDLEAKLSGGLDSKIAGSYYLPNDEAVPQNKKTGKELYLLVQLNFDQLPMLPDFPEHGLLQIFIAGDDDVYGADFEDEASQERWQLRYYETLPDRIDASEVHEPIYDEKIALPYPNESSYALHAKKSQQAISISDYRFIPMLKKSSGTLLPGNVESIYDLDDKSSDAFYDQLDTCSCQMGGYPCFTQNDPREDEKDPRHDVLLFQLDMVEDIMWRDSGVGNFFIRLKDLKNKDFSDVWYHWDCC